jgi:hypothetical protein
MTIIISKKRKRMAGPRGFGPLTCEVDITIMTPFGEKVRCARCGLEAKPAYSLYDSPRLELCRSCFLDVLIKAKEEEKR